MASSREPSRDDLGDTVRTHRDAVEHASKGFHRPLLVRDDDELCPVCVAAQQLPAADVRVVERRLDLVEEERTRAREEEREQERGSRRAPSPPDRSDKRVTRLPAGAARPRSRLPRPRPPARSAAAALAAREERLATSAKLPRQPCTSPRSGAGRSRRDRPQLLQLLQALLEIGALCRELFEPLLLGVVLLLRERVHLTESDPTPLEPSTFSASSSRSSPVPASLQFAEPAAPPTRLRCASSTSTLLARSDASAASSA